MTGAPPALPLPGDEAAAVQRRILSGTRAQILTVTARAAEQVVLLPVFLVAWGADVYANWLLLLSLANIASVLDLGQVTYWGNRLSLLHARGDHAAYRGVAGVGFAAVLAPLALGSVLLAGPVGRELVHGARLAPPETSLPILATLVLWAAITVLQGYVIGLYRASLRFATGVYAAVAVSVFSTATAAGAALLGASPLQVGLLLSGTALGGLLVTGAGAWRDLPPAAVPGGPRHRRELRKMVSLAPLNLVPQAVQWGLLNGSLLVLQQAGAGADVIIAFVAVRTLSGFARQFVHQASHGAGVELGRAWNQGDPAAAVRIVAGAGPLFGCLGGLLAGVLVGVGTPLLQLWSVGRVAVEPSLLLVIGVGLVIAAPANLPLLFFHYSNRPQALATATAAGAAAALAAMYLLAGPLGLLGAVASIVTGDMLVTPLLAAVLAERHWPVGWMRRLLTAAARGMMVAGLAGAGSATAVWLATGWAPVTAVLAGAATGAVIAAPVAFRLGLAPRHQAWLLQELGLRRRTG